MEGDSNISLSKRLKSKKDRGGVKVDLEIPKYLETEQHSSK